MWQKKLCKNLSSLVSCNVDTLYHFMDFEEEKMLSGVSSCYTGAAKSKILMWFFIIFYFNMLREVLE